MNSQKLQAWVQTPAFRTFAFLLVVCAAWALCCGDALAETVTATGSEDFSTMYGRLLG